MVGRCTRITDPRYADYGGRGITVCPRWLQFSDFLKDMGLAPNGMTLERKDNQLGYFKDNCVWASAKHQARNTRRNHLVLFGGKSISVAELAEINNLDYRTLYKRLRLGWTPEEAVTTPVRHFKL